MRGKDIHLCKLAPAIVARNTSRTAASSALAINAATQADPVNEISFLGWSGFSRHDVDGCSMRARGSLMFTPEISLAPLYAMRERFVQYRYGFSDAFRLSPTSRHL
jgi:hypothetical protein